MSSDAVIATNDDATICKRSAVDMGYWKDEALASLVLSKTRKTPEINRGYFSRVASIYRLVEKFLRMSGKCQIVNLGAGFDTLFWRLKADGHHLDCYVEIDVSPVTSKKIAKIRNSKALLTGIVSGESGDDIEFNVSDLHSQHFHIVSADLSNTLQVEAKLKKCGVNYGLPTLFLSECVLVYLDTPSSDSLLKWITSSFESCFFVNYEQVNLDDKFGAVMVRNLHSCGCVLAGIDSCKDKPSQTLRFLNSGCTGAHIWTLNEVYDGLPREDIERIERLEFLDEKELLVQLLEHYCLCTAWKDPKKFGFDEIDFK
ncbi:unnamed protein product [Notodromas monacha]|uniref:Leucine carboxyl methyltransferase 1 n=1 Tax=Notodromas monacha TaxID=399045 RepID=A0A7R9GAI2_9CRUS|nr:unnamed protein product [Notodromas monacha]CAG0913732.1 unnamed protein product [Notodromas monacha]